MSKRQKPDSPHSIPSRDHRERSISMTYLITFACYGCHLHGDSTGSVDRDHCIPGSRRLESSPTRIAGELSRMRQPAYRMDERRRQAVLAALVHRCSDMDWALLAAHVRTNHVHVVISAEATPERLMNDLKSFASRRLNQLGFDQPYRKRWARHGSSHWLWKQEAVLAAIHYVTEKQGEKMGVYDPRDTSAPFGRGSVDP